MLNLRCEIQDSKTQQVAAAGSALRPHFQLFKATCVQVDAERASFESPECSLEFDEQDCDRQGHGLPSFVVASFVHRTHSRSLMFEMIAKSGNAECRMN